jgi:hypothetical protein
MVIRFKNSSGHLLRGSLLIAMLFATGLAPQDDSLRVEAKATGARYFVGQAIEVRVGIVAQGERPKVFPPRVEGAEITKVDEAFRQIGVSGIGDSVSESNLFLSRFRVIPSRPGPLSIPPFHARVDARSGASKPIGLDIQPLPSQGRPASYLRGVGRLGAKAEAVPSSVRVGQTFDYRLILDGPGARGATQWPLLTEFEAIKGLKVEPSSTDVVADPPSRIFHVKIRPTLPGDLALPSIPVATFDPALRRYIETRAPSVSVRVVDVPRFDPASLEASVPKIDAHAPVQKVIPMLVASLVAGVGTSVLVILLARLGTAPRVSAKRWARALRTAVDPSGVAGRVTSALASYLSTTTGASTGQLTPEEASRGIERAVGDASLAEQAGLLIERCDRARFGLDPEAASGLATEAADFFDELATRRVRRALRLGRRHQA